MLPQPLKYQNKVESAMARSLRSNIAPQGGTTYGLNDTITINIPTRNNLVLVPQESYLKFSHSFTNTSGAAATYRWDACGAHGIIQSIKVFHGSNQLEFIDNYGNFAKMLYDLQMPSDAVYNKLNITSGTRSDLVLNLAGGATALPADGSDLATTQALANAVKNRINNSQLSAFQRNSGDLIGVSVANNGSTTTRTYCLNLISMLGSLCSQYFPLFACTSAPLRLEIQLVPSIMACCAATSNTGSMTVSNVEYIGQFIELSDQAVDIIRGSLGSDLLQFAVSSWRNVPGSTNSSTTGAGSALSANVALPFKFSSLKSILISQRDNASGTALRFPFSSIRNGLSNYTFRIGAMTRPSKAVDSVPEMFSEALKAIGSIADITACPAVSLENYDLNENTTIVPANDVNFSLQQSGSFYVGIDLENYPNSEKSKLFAGYNSTTDDIFFQPNYLNLPIASTRIDAYACYDQVVVFENGTSYVKF